ncbi:MAG: cysteine desulfurase family protein [Candidatus Paceibacterota bacterium]
MRKIYLDHAGATYLDLQVKRVILSQLGNFGNASSVHGAGRLAKKSIDASRKEIASILNSKPEEIVFTGSGTESDNLAIFGVARANKKLGKHIIATKIEHHAVLRACQYLEKNEGFKVSYLDVGDNGIVDPVAVAKALRPDTTLVSIMYANNEIGTIQPISRISKTIREFRRGRLNQNFPFLHTDACQAAGALNLNVQELGVDLLTLNGSKIYGPKGAGLLYARKGVAISPVIVGGSQEGGLRAGTENPALIAGLAKALEVADRIKGKEGKRLAKLRDYTIESILSHIPGTHLNGDSNFRLPNNVNISFASIDGEMLMLALDQEGIQVSTGSACTTGTTEASHVIKALGLGEDMDKGNLRITLGRKTTKKDIEDILKTLPKIIGRLRR